MRFLFLVAATLSQIVFSYPVFAQSLNNKPPALRLSDPLPGNLFVELARVINPAVVNISTAAKTRSMPQDPYFEMLERFYGFPGRVRPDGKPTKIGLGTGFVVRDDGLIVTNAHVLRGADLVTVAFDESGKTYDAKIIGSDERSDIALLKVKADFKLTVAAFGNSSALQVGEWVAAFGNPFGHGHSMSKGIISSKGRALGEINKFPLLQTDASINPGNSGGPLVNTKGEVIGVNSAIDARAQGIGFAIPIDEVKRIIPELEKNGQLRKGFLGVSLADVASYDDQDMIGAGIAAIDPGGPAAKGGAQQGDIVVEYDGKKISSANELVDAVADTTPNKKIKLKILRANQRGKTQEKEIYVTVAERSSTEIRRQEPHQLTRRGNPRPSNIKSEAVPYNLGFSVATPTADILNQFDLPEKTKNPIIVEVEPDGFVGIEPGDILLEVNGTAVKTAQDVVKSVKKSGNTLKISRGPSIVVLTVN